MTTTTVPTPPTVVDTPAAGPEPDEARIEELIGRLLESVTAFADLLTIHLGDELGLYRSLATDGPATPTELAARAGIHERYATEWLEQQAVTGFVEVDQPSAVALERRYRLPLEHALVLVERDSPAFLGSVGRMATALTRPFDQLVDAYRTGGGVPFDAYGDDARTAQADLNRPAYLHALGAEWFPQIPDVHARLQAEPPARVADVGCGFGWSTIAIAQAYPNALVDGFDADDESIAAARRNAVEAGVADRVRFEVADACELRTDTTYDLVTAFEMLHDLRRPVDALARFGELAGPDGVVLVVDERVGDDFAAPGDLMERFMYGASCLFCLPTARVGDHAGGTGTVMRTSTLEAYAAEAGVGPVDVLGIEHPMWRFYRLGGTR